MSSTRRGVTLIGMPGAGKSTIGVLLSKRLVLDFLDTDLLIQLRAGRTLQQIVDQEGHLRLRALEEQVLLDCDPRGRVIATGGSAVYSPAAMRHLGLGSELVFLDVGLEELRRRIDDYDTRGIARRPGQGLVELFNERCELYRRHADIRIDCNGLDSRGVVERLVQALLSRDDSAAARMASSTP
jgi:shikimate kinase